MTNESKNHEQKKVKHKHYHCFNSLKIYTKGSCETCFREKKNRKPSKSKSESQTQTSPHKWIHQQGFQVKKRYGQVLQPLRPKIQNFNPLSSSTFSPSDIYVA